MKVIAEQSITAHPLAREIVTTETVNDLVNSAGTTYAFRLDKERLGPLWTLPLQQFVYRQLMYLVVIQSVVTALAGVHLGWHRMERYGSLRVPPAAEGQV